jgi:hypothetical protein
MAYDLKVNFPTAHQWKITNFIPVKPVKTYEIRDIHTKIHNFDWAPFGEVPHDKL